jgi:hypothetical protein
MQDKVLASRAKKDTQCSFLVEEGTLWRLRKAAAEKHFRSVSHLMRSVAQTYLDKEMGKEEKVL